MLKPGRFYAPPLLAFCAFWHRGLCLQHACCSRHTCMTVQVDTDFSNDLDVRVMLLVHDTRPPFLDGRVIFTKQAEAVMPLRDPTSDLAVIAKTGSKLVKEIRDKKNEGKSRQRFWEVAGSKMGKITGQSSTSCYLACKPKHDDAFCSTSKLRLSTLMPVALGNSSELGIASCVGVLQKHPHGNASCYTVKQHYCYTLPTAQVRLEGSRSFTMQNTCKHSLLQLDLCRHCCCPVHNSRFRHCCRTLVSQVASAGRK